MSLCLQRLASVGQAGVAAALGIHESTLSRHVSNKELERSLLVLAELGLKVVPVDLKCYRPEDIDPYIRIAQQHLRNIQSASDLLFEDQE